MILTLTPNPAIDVTMHISGQVQVGELHRASAITRVAAGKGVNVSRTIHQAGHKTLAIAPAAKKDPFVSLLSEAGIPSHTIAVDDAVRVNTTVSQSNGTTTQFNGTGAYLSAQARNRLMDALYQKLPSARVLIIAGSLPLGAPETFIAEVIAQVQRDFPKLYTVVDSSGAAMQAVAGSLIDAPPSLLAPNERELAEITGRRLEDFRNSIPEVVCAARTLVETVSGASTRPTSLLVTLGARGALLVSEDEVLHAPAPKVVVRSTVGAGDATLAGFLMARKLGTDKASALRQAVTYGSAASMLPGTSMPTPSDVHALSSRTPQVVNVEKQGASIPTNYIDSLA